MHTHTHPIDALLAVLHSRLSHFKHDASDVGDEVRQVLQVWPNAHSPRNWPQPQHTSVAAHLDAALTLASRQDAAELAACIRPLAPWLRWTFGYPEHPMFPELESQVAFAQMVGPGDMAHSDELLIGLALLAPHTVYPAHAHPAHEIYLPIGGTGIWSRGASAAEAQAPGAIILHPSNVVHTTVSHADPVLAIYFWRGDLITASQFVMAPGHTASASASTQRASAK